MYTFVLVIHMAVALFLILIVLLQIGKAGSLGGIFGGGGGEQLFSTPSGSDLLRKMTIVLAIIFLITSMSLTFVSYRARLTTVTGKMPYQPPAAATQSPQPQPASPQQQ